MAYAMGFSWPEVARMASLNPCLYYGLAHRGNIRPGYVADIVVTDEACNRMLYVLKNGRTPDSLSCQEGIDASGFPNSVHFARLSADQFVLPRAAIHTAIAIVDGQLLTKRVTVSEAELKKCNLLATIERHGKNGNIAVCPLLGYGIKQGLWRRV